MLAKPNPKTPGPAHIMPPTPGPANIMPATPESAHIMQSTSKSACVMLSKPKPAHIMHTTPDLAHVIPANGAATQVPLHSSSIALVDVEFGPGLIRLIASVLDPSLMSVRAVASQWSLCFQETTGCLKTLKPSKHATIYCAAHDCSHHFEYVGTLLF